MVLELENLHYFVFTSLSLISMVKITSICIISSAVEMRFPQKLLVATLFIIHIIIIPETISVLNLKFNIWKYFPIHCNWNDVLKTACKCSITKILTAA